MLQSRSIDTPRASMASKQYATEGSKIPLKKNWSETWCTLGIGFDQVLPQILNMEVPHDDVFIVTFIKCGTTWMQETVWLLMNNLDFERSKKLAMKERSPFIDLQGLQPQLPNVVELCKNRPGPRVLESHLPANLLPLDIWKKKTKIIYVGRNCKDVIVSSYHFLKNLGYWIGDNLDDFAEDFMNNETMYTCFWTHIVDFWQMRNEPNIFFTTYEEMRGDLGKVIEKLWKFLERPPLTKEEMENILNHLSFENMKGNNQTNLTEALKGQIPSAKEEFQFMRRGIVGSFKDELSPELQKKIDEWSREYLAQNGLTEEDIFGKV